mmetsp:Transcript_25661/g.48646  ORF Transcript_25661/g.48646 Transcript_25661/m.48646 type:complete len:282 (-) Transcript_25661:251-1096(-)
MRFHTTLSGLYTTFSGGSAPPSIHSLTAELMLSNPNSTCPGSRPPCAKTVSFTTSTVGFCANLRASGAPGEKRARRARACMVKLTPGLPKSAVPSATIDDSRKAAGVTYLKSPETFRVSWLPLRMYTAPPSLAAPSPSCHSNRKMPISSSPRSSTSPICTSVALPPIHTAGSPITGGAISPASCSTRMVCTRSPCRSPIAMIRPSAVTKVGGGTKGSGVASASSPAFLAGGVLVSDASARTTPTSAGSATVSCLLRSAEKVRPHTGRKRGDKPCVRDEMCE